MTPPALDPKGHRNVATGEALLARGIVLNNWKCPKGAQEHEKTNAQDYFENDTRSIPTE